MKRGIAVTNGVFARGKVKMSESFGRRHRNEENFSTLRIENLKRRKKEDEIFLLMPANYKIYV